jgi:AraC-like DNA-binding protein
MPFNFTYDELSTQGLFKAFHKYFGVEMKDGLLQVDNEIGKLNMQYLNIPGDIEIIFIEYNYFQDILFNNQTVQVQQYTLAMDCAQNTLQEYTVNNETVIRNEEVQRNAYLMNAIFPYKQLRKAGSCGKSLMIFMPSHLLDGFTVENDEIGLLGKFYSLQNKGQSLMQLGTNELKKIESLFYQWKNYKNILSITKYTYQLIEWYFSKLIIFLESDIHSHKLLPKQAQDLFLLKSIIQNNLSESNLDLSEIQHTFSTPFTKLKQLFEKVHAQSIHEYFKELKLIQSMKVLLGTEKNIAEIAYEFGYANPSNFSASFKKYYLLGPNEYRLKNKSTQD